MTALRYFPGHVVVLGTESLQQHFDETYISSFTDLVASNNYHLSAGQYYLELFVVNKGEELRFLDHVSALPGVIGASLDYIGFGLSEDYIDDDDYLELSYEPGRTPPRDSQCFVQCENDENIENVTYRGLLDTIERVIPKFIIAAIDVDPRHCMQVMGLIVEGVNRNRRDNAYLPNANSLATIIGLTANVDNSMINDLFGFSDRLLLLANLFGPNGIDKETNNAQVVSINMSVDFSQVIRGYNDLQPADMESPDMLYGLPFFEKQLALVVSELTRYGNSPAIFAAAGNRMKPGGRMRVRLGYPATRPEVIAASLVVSDSTSHNRAQPSDWVDVPSTTGLKPCFAIDVDDMALSRSDGSSFASAWLSGYYASLACKQNEKVMGFGQLSKVAWLMQRTDRKQLPSGRHRLPCFVAVVRETANSGHVPGEMDELISSLGEAFHGDFCLHGSLAAVGEWLRINDRCLKDIEPWARKDLGDVDLIVSGNIRGGILSDVKEFTLNWLKNRLGRSWVMDSKRRIEIHPYEGFISSGERLRSLAPVNKLYLTRGGVIDTWDGLGDLKRRTIRILLMTHTSFWVRNKLYGTGADCLALNILHWLSITSLLQLVSSSVGIAGPIADQESARQIEEVLGQAEERKSEICLFGLHGGDTRERLYRRFDRVEALMGTCARHGMVDNTVDMILRRLYFLNNNEP